MIAYIRGTLAAVEAESIIMEAGQIGYHVRVPLTVLNQLPPVGSELKIHTCFQVREDSMQLFGFLTRDDLEVFRLLLGVNGVGPKAALGVLSALSANDLRFAVLSGDVKAIAKAPGLGPKTAQKVILELKDKMKLEDAFEDRLEAGSTPGTTSAPAGDARSEAIQALTALGYSASEAMKAVKGVEDSDTMDVETLLKHALKKMAFL